jgi:2-polyprenyl-6-methoxyphenol hydroxylase-like FAD-dependent oxidoreductase
MTAPSHAVVIGASIAGLLAAAALSGACPRVTLFERDTLPAEPGPRRGVPQTRQLHALQARGVQALDELLPGLRDELVAAGGVLADMQGDIHWYLDDYLLKTARTGLEGIGISRPLLEWLIRSRVAALPGVTITDATDVVGLATADDHVTGVTVRAARTRDAAEETIAADLVIDAAGAGSRIPVWLPQLGLDAPRTTRVRAGVTYVTRMYRRDQKQLDGRFGSLVTPYPGRPFGGAVLRQEGERWVVLLAGMVGTEPPLDEDGMIAFADQFACGDIAAVLRESAPLTEPLKYTYPESARNHYEKLGGRPGGLLVIGDAYCGFNPIYGQGITIAALEALILRRLLGATEGSATKGSATKGSATEGRGTEDSGAGLARAYFQAAGKLVDEAWETSASSDLRFPEVEGRRRRGAGLINAYGEKFRAAASVDPALGETFLRVANMADKPAKLLSPGTVLRVFRSAGKAVRAGRGE